jgi:hypothetical protein
VVGVASTPICPLSLIAAAISASGSTTVSTSTPRSSATSRTTSPPAEVAELHATTSSFEPRSSRNRVDSAIRGRSQSRGLVP